MYSAGPAVRVAVLSMISYAGLVIKILSREPNLLKLPRDVVYRNQYISLQKFEGAAGEFKGALGPPAPSYFEP